MKSVVMRYLDVGSVMIGNTTHFLLPPVTVCSGTKNALSMTGSSDMQYKLIKEMYTGCEIVMGNLEITMMEPARNFSFLQVSATDAMATGDNNQLPLSPPCFHGDCRSSTKGLVYLRNVDRNKEERTKQ